MTEPVIHFLDNSTLSTIKQCALQAHYRYEMHWTSIEQPIYFDFGTAWHSAMDALWQAVCWEHHNKADAYNAAVNGFNAKWVELGLDPNPNQAVAEEWSPRTPGIAREMLKNYIDIRYDWLRYKITLLAVEQPFVVPLDPDDPTIFVIGRLDKVVEENGEIIVPEHKTTTDYRISGDHFSPKYIGSFDPNSQMDTYNHGLRVVYGAKAKGVLVDAAMVHKKVHDAFRLIPAYRTPHQLEAWRQETLYWFHSWLQFKETGFFPKNTNGCVNQWHKTCEYINTCRQYSKAVHDLEPPRGMQVKKWEPYDLDVLHQAAKEVMSNG